MSADLLEKINHDLHKCGEELWNIDVSDKVLDDVLQTLSLLRVQVNVRKSLQATTNLLRQQPNDKAFPKQQATKVKHFIRFVFRKESRGGGRHKQLRDLDCNAIKFFGLSYTIEEIVKMDDGEFETLKNRGVEFFHRGGLSRLLYRPDVDKAVNASFTDPDDDGSYEKFMQDHLAIRLQMRKRKHDDMGSGGASTDNQVARNVTSERSEMTATTNQSATANENKPEDENQNKNKPENETETSATTAEKAEKYGDVFSLSLDAARYALSFGDDVKEIYLTKPWATNELGQKPPFLTAWFSEGLGEILSKQAQQIYY